MGFQIKKEFLNLVLYVLKRKEFKYRSSKFAYQNSLHSPNQKTGAHYLILE